MIWLRYEDKTAYFGASGNDFADAIEIFKQCRLKYNPTTKLWAGGPIKALKTLEEAQGFMIPVGGNYDVESIERDKYHTGNRELSKLRRSLHYSLLKYAPIEGKPPHERYQVNAIKRGISQNRLAFFLGVGTGKTYIAIGTMNHLFHLGEIDRLLVVAPPEGVVNWKREILRFATFVESESDILLSHANDNRDFTEGEHKVAILTYRHFLTVSDDYHKAKTGRKSKKYINPSIPLDEWGSRRAIVLDESHNIKNPQARTSHVIHLHKKSFEYRYLLTGTPTPNIFTEIYSQMKFLDPSVVPRDYYEWLDDVANLGNKFSKYALNFVYDSKIKEWEEIFKPFVLRLKTEEVIDLPELYMKPIYVELSSKQREIYQGFTNQEIDTLKEEDGKIIPRKLINRFSYISMALDNPILLQGKIDGQRSPDLKKSIEGFRFESGHNKVAVTKSLVHAHIQNGQKVVIFDHHPKTLDKLHDIFKKYSPIVIHGERTYGSTASQDGESNESSIRDSAIEEFKNSDNRQLLIVSSRIMTTSINLQEATVAIYFSRDYSYLNWSQSLARLYRLGQTRSVTVYPLIFENSLDEALERSLQNKEDLDKSVFSRKLKNKDSLTLDEWKGFFRGKM